MVKLFCAIVGAAGSAFSVRVDESDEPESVDDLKKEIKKEKMYQYPADELQLFLAKKDKGRGAWLTEEEAMSGVGDTTDLKLLRSARAEIGHVGLSEDDVRLQVTKEEVEALKGPVHVLVVVPEQGTSAPIVSEGGVFDRCSDPFFSKFQTVYQVGSTFALRTE
ncbi:hypothetical protein PI124_g24525 [Phytophthora idaei]|nr:hypothetical protein PI124_g24525 [Phytophthora idaei]